MNERRDLTGLQVQSAAGYWATVKLGLPVLSGELEVSFRYRGGRYSVVTAQDATQAQVSAAVLARLDMLDPDLDWADFAETLSGEEV